jgi:hypothetical protein
MKAHDVRHFRFCCFCGGLGDGRKMLNLPGRENPAHDVCAVQRLPQTEILMLPASEREKITLGAAGVDLMRRLLERA